MKEARASEIRLPSEPWRDPSSIPFIKIRNAVKKFDNIVAVDDIWLDIYRGEFFSLLGPQVAARRRCCACLRIRDARLRHDRDRRGHVGCRPIDVRST